MSLTVGLENLRRRLREVKRADDARNTLLEDLVQKVDEMQKSMDRNAFIMVLIDGDCTLFLNELVKNGIAGGDEAAKSLRKSVYDYLRYDDNFKLDHKIVIQVYANIRGLSKTYVDKGILPNTAAFADFVLGFNKAHPLCNFIDAGNHKEAADSKLKENLNLYVYNLHCKHIIFGASADNAYASFLGSFLIDSEISSRIKLLKGLPFSAEFASILPKLQYTEFPHLFRSETLAYEPESHSPQRRNQVADHFRDPVPTLTKLNDTWRPKLAGGSSPSDSSVTSPMSWASGCRQEAGVYLRRDTNDYSSNSTDDSLFTSPSESMTLGQLPRSGTNSIEKEVEFSLINSVNQHLKHSPKSIDFSVVKQDVEMRLGLTSEFWGKSEHDEWFTKSKNIIKKAVENWVERTGNPPPKNATWMPQFFQSNRGSPMLSIRGVSPLYRPMEDDKRVTSINNRQVTVQQSVGRIYRNSKGQRVDIPTEWNVEPATINVIRSRDPRLCNSYYLADDCSKDPCPFDHHTRLSDDELACLLYLSRSQPCSQGSTCDSVTCVKGHTCPNGKYCKHGNRCRLSHFHGIDTEVVM